MKADFDACVRFVLDQEAGYVDHPADPGGATNRGITLGTLSLWRGHEVTKDDVKNLAQDEAEEIYRARYWDACHCGEIPGPVALVLFDTAVNSGSHRAAIFLQQAVGARPDGNIGHETIILARAHEPLTTAMEMIALRLDFLKGLPTWGIFGEGWTNRCLKLTAAVREMTST